MKVSVFGNPNIPEDALPLKIATYLKNKLPQVEFVHQDPQEEIMPLGDKIWWIIDTVRGFSEVKLITNLDQVKEIRRVTLHDYDLSTELKLIKKINPNLEIRIIGVPPQGDIPKLAEQVFEILTK